MKLSWGYAPVILLGCFMVFILSLIFFAGDTGTLITSNSYEQGLEFQNEIDAQNRYNALLKKPILNNQANGILIRFPENMNPTEGKVLLRAYVDDKNDVLLDLKLNRNHTFLIPANKLKAGEYHFQLYWLENKQEFLYKNKALKWTSP